MSEKFEHIIVLQGERPSTKAHELLEEIKKLALPDYSDCEVECPNGEHKSHCFCFLCNNTGFVSVARLQEYRKEQDAKDQSGTVTLVFDPWKYL
ncbi:MAG: hypothetical protein QM496_01795 [Verrucomicrobiota bacterium]